MSLSIEPLPTGCDEKSTDVKSFRVRNAGGGFPGGCGS
jgi:hypothetical protein